MPRIRPEEPADIPVIRELNLRAFGRPDEGRLVDAIRQRTEPTISLVATETDGEIVGHILFSPVVFASAPDSVSAVGLGPMAVAPAHQRSGVGSALIRHGLNVCRDTGFDIVVVLGHPAFYPRFGFVLARAHGIHWEHEMPGDPFMVMELKPGALQRVSGMVRYLPEFMSI